MMIVSQDTVIRGAVLSFLREDADMPWPKRDVSTLKALFYSGLSFGLIGKRMGKTRNQVMGKIKRLRLERSSTRLALRHKQQRRPKKAPSLYAVALTVTPTVTHGVALFDLTATCCRFIIGEDAKGARFCTETKREASPYCPDHHRRCYVQRRAA